MLESIRKQGASAAIYLIFGLLIAIFIVNMGNGSGKQGGGCGGESNTSITVEGSKVNHTSFLAAQYSPINPGRSTQQRKYYALELLIRRELLAREAERRGIRVSSDMVEDAIKRGEFFMGGGRHDLGANVFDVHDDGDRTWNFNRFKRFVGGLNISVTSYQDEQERELQATLMAEILQNSVMVSENEAYEQFMFENDTVTYDVVTFDPSTYRSAMRLTEDDVARFLATHEDEVKARFKSDERLYDDKPAQLRLRQIFIAKAETAAAKPDDKKAADKKPDEVKAVGMPIDAAKARLEAVRTAAAADPKKFVEAAKELSTDDAAKAMAGAIGWHTTADAQLADKAVTDAVKTLKVGDMTPVIATDKGVYLVRAEEAREKKVTYDQAKLDIAQDLARDVWSKEKAKRDAIKALAEAQGKELAKIYEKDPASPQPHLNRAKKREQEKMMEQLRKQMQQQQQEGRLDPPGDHWVDHLASWDAEDTAPKGAGGGSGSGSGSGSGAGSAVGAGSAGSGSGSAAGAPAPTPTPAGDKEVVATTDQLPVFADVPAPKATRFTDMPKQDTVIGLGASKDAAKAINKDLAPLALAPRVYEVKDTYAIAQLVARNNPKKDDFAKEAADDLADLRRTRAAHFLETWLKTRCEELAKDNKITPADDLIRETDGSGNPLSTTTYHACMSFGVGPVGADEE